MLRYELRETVNLYKRDPSEEKDIMESENKMDKKKTVTVSYRPPVLQICQLCTYILYIIIPIMGIIVNFQKISVCDGIYKDYGK